ncbi:MAG: ROK family glucokinase [Mycobacteriales bacterium]
MALTIGVDVGGTKVASGVVDDDGRILARLQRPTPSTSAQDTAAVIADLVESLRADHEVSAVGIGAAGFVDAARSTVLFAPNLAWRDEPLREEVADKVGLPVVVENDANAMAWGEYRFGAGRGEGVMVAITVGTGIGGGIVLDGALFRGRWGIGAEVGHLRVVPDGRPCGCGNKGCWEQYASGRALTREARELATARPDYAARLLELGGGRPEGIDGPEITTAAKEGDPAAVECFAIIGRWLGQGMADLAAVLDPGRFVAGGGVIDAGELLLGPARAAYAEALTAHGHRPLAEIRPAELGPDAGLVGAADLARTPA